MNENLQINGQTDQEEQEVLSHDDKQLLKLEKILQGIQPGWKVAIHREAPSWCRSYLETIELGEAEELDLDYLADNWGGDSLRLRFMDSTGTYRASVVVPMRSYPPKVRGRRITRNFESDDDALPKNARYQDQPIQQIIQTPAQQNPFNLDNVMNFAKNLSGDQLKLFKTLSENTKTDVPQVQNSFENVIDMIYQIKELQGIFGEAETKLNAPGDDQAMLMQTIGDIAKALLTNKPAPQPQTQRLVRHNPQGPIQPQRPNIAAVLAGLPPDQSADIVLTALGRMPPEKREQAVKEVISRLGQETDLDYDEEDDEGDDFGDDDTNDDQSPDITENSD